MLSNDEISQVEQGHWSIYIPELEIVRRDAGDKVRLRGSGSLQTSQNGILELTGHFNTEKSVWDLLRNYINMPAGRLLPESEYWDLIARDTSGRTWKADRIRPDLGPTALAAISVQAQLGEITCRTEIGALRPGRSLSFWVFHPLEIPCNEITRTRTSTGRGFSSSNSLSRDAWRFTTSGVEVLLHRETKTRLSIRCASKAIFPERFERRLVEALHFVLGRRVDWTLMRRSVTGGFEDTLRSRRPAAFRSRHQPPLPCETISIEKGRRPTSRFHSRLVHLYLQHTLDSTERRHPLWGLIHAVDEAGTTEFINFRALTVSVAVEALLSLEFSEVGAPDQRIGKELESIQAMLADYLDPLHLLPRILGQLGQLKEVRADDRLRKLASDGKIDQEHAKAWKKLRNVSTHSFQMNRITSEELVRLLRQVEVLFYHLIFCAIGYRGPYLDISSEGWPRRFYPQACQKSSGREVVRSPRKQALPLEPSASKSRTARPAG